MMTLETCRFCGLRLVKPCQTEDQADDCERKPCPEPDDVTEHFTNTPRSSMP